ncbi:hypothetical protein vBRpoSV10_11 [Ruegeria phage vB_RpoS-V10]|nr:hypothetical protein vBRpoSV10_11 [Ruegeria phage vB_RpoS-V10]
MTTEIFRCVAGSRLFGTATAQSDTDYKSVFIPSARDILMGNTMQAKQTSTGDNKAANAAIDVDCTSFSLQRYLSLLGKMETNAIEMLFAPNLVDDWAAAPMKMIYNDRFKIMTDNKDAFVGFGKSQAMRYAVRGDRLDTLVAVVARLKEMDPHRPIAQQLGGTDKFWMPDAIPNLVIYDKRDEVRDPASGRRDSTPYMSVFGREVPLTARPGEAIKVYQKPIDEAGKRTKASAATGGPDWKGLYHAQRIVDEGIELFSTGELLFPCQNKDAYIAIRTGQMELEDVLLQFEDSLAQLEELTPIREFREGTDEDWGNELVMAFHEQKVVDAYHAWRETT